MDVGVGTTGACGGAAGAAVGVGVGAGVPCGVDAGAATRADAPGLCRDSAVADGLMGCVSGGVGRGAGFGGVVIAGAVTAGFTGGAAAAEGDGADPRSKSLICSTIPGSRLAKALSLTSRPHFWIRSSNSWLFRPSSFANSWTRVDNGNSSWVGPWPGPASSARSIGLLCQFPIVRTNPIFAEATERPSPPSARKGPGGGWRGAGRRGDVVAIGPRGALPLAETHGCCMSESRPSSESDGNGSVSD